MTRTHDAWGHPYPETPASQNRTPWGREVAQESPGRTHDAWGYPKEKVTETYVNAWGREITRTVSETEKSEPKPATPIGETKRVVIQETGTMAVRETSRVPVLMLPLRERSRRSGAAVKERLASGWRPTDPASKP